MQNADQQSESSLGSSYYKNKGKNSTENSRKIDDSTLKSIFDRVEKLEKDNETFRSLAFDFRALEKEKNELKAKNDELEKRVAELESFKENSNLGNQERDFQIEEVQKTTESFTKKLEGEIKKLKFLKERAENEFDEMKKSAAQLEIIRNVFEFPAKHGFGNFYELDSREFRLAHDENAVRRVLKGMAAGFTKFNLKFYAGENLRLTEAGWTIVHRSRLEDFGGDGFWKMWITFNGKRVDFQAEADEMNVHGKIYNSAKKLTPDSRGMVELEGCNHYVRWNITILK